MRSMQARATRVNDINADACIYRQMSGSSPSRRSSFPMPRTHRHHPLEIPPPTRTSPRSQLTARRT